MSNKQIITVWPITMFILRTLLPIAEKLIQLDNSPFSFRCLILSSLCPFSYCIIMISEDVSFVLLE